MATGGALFNAGNQEIPLGDEQRKQVGGAVSGGVRLVEERGAAQFRVAG